MKYKNNIIFDLDGTLVNPKIGITTAVQYSLKKFNIIEENLDSLEKFIGPPLHVSYSEFYGFDKEKSLKAVEYYREYYSTTGLHQNILYDGIVELLSSLKKSNKNIFLATSKPTIYAKIILDDFDLTKYFKFVGGSALDESRSEKAEVIKYVLTENNIIDIENSVMIGDRKYDIIGASINKMDSIGVTYGFGSKNELIENGATVTIDSIEELKNILLV